MPTAIMVDLGYDELITAINEGHARYEATQARRAKSNGPRNQSPDNDTIGVMGEMAFAKWSGLPWTASKGATYDSLGADVGELEVRTRRMNSDKHLTLKFSAQYKYPDSRLYVLAWAAVYDPMVYLVGYTSLEMIRVYGEIRNDWSCYSFNYKDLNDLRELFRGRES